MEAILPFAIDKTATTAQLEALPTSNSETAPPKTAPTTSDSSLRKRKAHKKSRKGCQGCKLRRVKCDEARPKCQKCQDFGVDCSYVSKSTGLKFAGESSFVIEKPTYTTPSTQTLVLGQFRAPSPASSTSSGSFDDKFAPFRWLPQDLEVLARFQEHTVLTVGIKSTAKLYQNEIFKLATHYPFLTHVVLTLTLMHDRHRAGAIKIDERAMMHWIQGTALFKEALIEPEKQSKRDALWASAALLGCIQFACIEARTAEEAWPLKASSSEDLDWLKMSDGKKAVWKIANVTSPESIFNKIKGHPDLYRPLVFDASDLGHVTREFCELFNLNPSSHPEANPYHDAAHMLARLLPVECDSTTILEFLQLMSRVHPALKRLLEQKDPKALLLIACWYAKIYKYQWWIYRRGLLEGTAICIYLDRYYSHSKAIQNLLHFAKVSFGLVFTADHAVLTKQESNQPRLIEVSG